MGRMGEERGWSAHPELTFLKIGYEKTDKRMREASCSELYSSGTIVNRLSKGGVKRWI